ncbi:sialic acid-binding Ig-like lectin 6 isoform X5 [Megalobrama amblycephala]|uniref:sialic acid-binding Ig-like lectin 6 isoform X5 n=1 Tax=Megalobrama amblycephala TaxID=75352 RepID=UPI002013EBFF|nr:sialic acid-binding Ig-like lectin 6 isoform X5 [Megalobrama amblycephala]
MSQRPAPSLLLLFLLMIPGVSSADWGVRYSPSHICALKDSSVIMSCTYKYPTGYRIRRVFWTKTLEKDNGEFPDLSEDPEYSQRLQYLGDEQCAIRLSHVTLKDSHEYYFRFITDKGKLIGKPGVTLTVTDLQVESPERVTEGDSVRLTCKSSCTLTDRATFIWYRNSQPLTERRDRNNELLLQSVRREDAGRYSCAVHGHNHISPAVQINVMYPPKSVSVSISPSGKIVSGDSVTLICSSDSNPPAEISWFKGGTFVGSGRIYSISKISSDDSGEYKCRSRYKHEEKDSDAVTLKVHLGWHVWLGITVACLGFIIIIIIIIILFIIRKRRDAKAEDLTVKQDNLYSNVTGRDVHVSESADCDDAQYATVTSSKPRRDRNAPDRRDTEEIQYATVQHHKNKQTKRSEENESQYGNIRIHQPESAVRRSNVQTLEYASVIYSHVR